MRRLITLTLAIISFAFAALPAQASTNSATANLLTKSSKPQISIQFGRQRRYRRSGFRLGLNYGYSSRIETRIVNRGWATYRETYRVMYYPNGETRTELISRERIDY